ncbi:MAG TPA: hypothetical protein VGR62_14780 [Candidatus Binatia bacterium]|nr:hypothetical protein [Candidatus Binatia bacterium]
MIRVLVLLVCLVAPAWGVPTVAELASVMGVDADGIARIQNGEIVSLDPSETSDRELAVGMMFFEKAAPSVVMQQFRRGGDLKADPNLRGSYPITGPGTVDDFAALQLAPNGTDEAKRWASATPGETLNLSTAEIATLDALGDGTSQADVEAAIRRILLARFQAYRTSGLAGIAPYARDGESRDVGGALRASTTASPVIAKFAPVLREVLLDYPSQKPADLEESFFWLAYDLDDRPNLTLRHRMAMPAGDGFVVADREFYVSQGYNEMQALAGFLPAEGGTVVFYVTRTSTDRAGGFGSSAKHAIGRKVMAREIEAIFERSRAGLAK